MTSDNTRTDPQSSDDPLDPLAEEFLARLRRGERPSLAEYEDRYPLLASRVRQLFPALVEMEQVAPPSVEPVTPPPGSRAPIPKRIGEYHIIRKIGQGGMGVVYEAIQESLGRRVALKVLPAHRSGSYLERFRREARAAAKMHHTNIVPVFGVGEADGVHYYSMQYIAGQGLDSVLDEVRRLRTLQPDGRNHISLLTVTRAKSGPAADPDEPESDAATKPSDDPPAVSSVAASKTGSHELATQSDTRYYREIARLGLQAAEALAYAHAQGVLHRDIKPSNLLLDARGTLWVADFGLAKASDEEDFTRTGDFVGTLRYMAPERFDGIADVRSEVYALGVTLFELVTLRPAFEGRDKLYLIDQIRTGTHSALRSSDTQVPHDLGTIILKAMSREPADRYHSAAAMAEDLRRFLGDRVILARRATLFEQLRRWARRNTAVAALLATVMTILLAVAVSSILAAVRFRQIGKDADDARDEAVTAQKTARLREADALVGQAVGIRQSRRYGQRFEALAALTRAADIGRELEQPPEWFDRIRNEAVSALALPDMHITREWEGFPEGTEYASVGADFTRYVRSDGEGAVSVRRISDDAELACLPALGEPGPVQLSAAGVLIRVGTKSGRIQVWNIDGPTPALRLDERSGIRDWHLRADGKRVALFYRDTNTISVHDTASGERLYYYRIATTQGFENLRRVVLHPTAPVALLAGDGSQLRLVQFSGDQVRPVELSGLWQFPPNGTPEWSRDGRHLSVPDVKAGKVHLYHYEPTTTSLVPDKQIDLPRTAGTLRATFSPAGDLLAVEGTDGKIHLADVASGHFLFSSPAVRRWGQTAWSLRTGIQFDESGTRLAAARLGENGEKLGFWSVAAGREYSVIKAVGGLPTAQQFLPAVHPNGQLTATWDAKSAHFFDLESRTYLGSMPKLYNGANGWTNQFAFDKSGNLVEWGATSLLYRHLAPDPVRPSRWLIGQRQSPGFIPGDLSVALNQADGRLITQAMGGWQKMGESPGSWKFISPAVQEADVSPDSISSALHISPSGRWMAYESKVFDSATGDTVWRAPRGVARGFSPDGNWLIVQDKSSVAHKTGSWQAATRLGAGVPYGISPDSSLVVMTMPDGRYRLVELATGREILQIEDPDLASAPARFSTDGTKLLVAEDTSLRVWDLRTLRERLSELRLDWDAPPFPPAPAKPPPLSIHLIADSITPVAGTDLRDGRWQSAVDALAKLPDDPSARIASLVYRIAAYDRLGRHADAVSDRKELSRMTIDPIGSTMSYAGLHLTAGDYLLANALQESVLHSQPEHAAAMAGVAWSIVMLPAGQRDLKRALELAEKVVETGGGTPDSRNTLGGVYYRLGRYHDALSQLKLVAKKAPDGTPLTVKSTEGAPLSLSLAERRTFWQNCFLQALCFHQVGEEEHAREAFNLSQAARLVPRLRKVGSPPPPPNVELQDLRDEVRMTLEGCPQPP